MRPWFMKTILSETSTAKQTPSAGRSRSRWRSTPAPVRGPDRRIGAARVHNQFAAGQNTIELAVRRLGHAHGSNRRCEKKNSRFEQGWPAMHGKHARMMFIPLYRNLVCNNGIYGRKCAT